MTKLFIFSFAALLLSQCTEAHNGKLNTESKPTDKNVIKQDTVGTDNIHTQDTTAHNTDFAVVYDKADKAAVERLMSMPFGNKAETSQIIVSIARELRGVPYVAKTLEHNKTEKLVVNLRELDCTTYAESVLAIYECIRNGKKTFSDYCDYLRRIRYVNGEVSYPSRQHYFTGWIEENTKDGFVKEISTPNPPFSAVQHINLNFMSKHTSLYPMLKDNPEMVKFIAETESRLSGTTYRYIPKSALKDTRAIRSAIHDGDIIAITTSKAGLDTSHIGIAVWHKDGLHLLNASQIHKKVVEEPMTLYQYMQKHPSQTGVRIIRVN